MVLPASCLGRETLVGVLSELMRAKVVSGTLKARWALRKFDWVFQLVVSAQLLGTTGSGVQTTTKDEDEDS